MEVQMLYGLSGVRAAVGHHAIAIGESQRTGQAGNHRKNMPHQLFVRLIDLIRAGHVFLRDDQKMLRSQRRDILKRKALLILIELLCGNLSRDDLTENAVVHTVPPIIMSAE